MESRETPVPAEVAEAIQRPPAHRPSRRALRAMAGAMMAASIDPRGIGVTGAIPGAIAGHIGRLRRRKRRMKRVDRKKVARRAIAKASRKRNRR